MRLCQAMTNLSEPLSLDSETHLMISDPEVLDIANQIFHREIDLHNDVKIYESSKEYSENDPKNKFVFLVKDRDEKFSEVYEHVLSATRISNFENSIYITHLCDYSI